jgi:hypothetical protein
MSQTNQQKVDDCMSVINITVSRGGPGYNDWEKEFLESVEDQLNGGGGLTEKQEKVLQRLWDKI